MKTSLRFIKFFFHFTGLLTPIWVLLVCVVIALGLVIARIEGIAPSDGLYFAWVTGLTVGYGDITPDHPLSRLCALVIGLVGIVFSGIWVGMAVEAARQTLRPPDES